MNIVEMNGEKFTRRKMSAAGFLVMAKMSGEGDPMKIATEAMRYCFRPVAELEDVTDMDGDIYQDLLSEIMNFFDADTKKKKTVKSKTKK
jgi:hypothetical protein